MNESIVFGSRVGKLLVKMDYLEPDKESQYLSISGQCLKKEELKQAYLINQVSFHLPLLVRQSQSFVLSLKKQHQVEEHIINAEPGKQFYLLDFVLPSLNKNDVLEIELKQVEPALEWYVGDIRLSNENGRKIDLISSKQGNSIYLLEESLLKENIKQPDSFAFYGRKVVSSSLKFRVDVDESFLALVQPNKLPGLEKNGPCFYQTSKPNNFSSFSANEFKYAQQLPVLNLIVEEEFLSGDKGIYSNIEAKGRSSEVPAEIEYLSKDGLRAQNVGLRFHGGVHRRKPNALRGFRIYARRTYGNGSIGMPGDIFRQSDQKVETLVLRSNQAYGHLEDDYRDPNRGYNPFNHILALEIGERIGALVPRSQLVDFRINNVKQDLYLALDHLSETLFKQSYKSTDFKVFNYKKENTPLVEELYFSVKREIRESYGEDAFDVFMTLSTS